VRGIGDRQYRPGVLLPLGKEQQQTGTNILWVRGLNTKGEKYKARLLAAKSVCLIAGGRGGLGVDADCSPSIRTGGIAP
jgi:hypothetical protein